MVDIVDTFDNYSQIRSISFNVFSNEEIKNASAVFKEPLGIDIPEMEENGIPKTNGVLDLRMGTTEHGKKCATCGLGQLYCPGHFGHCELVIPVFHFGYIEYVKDILSCICLNCYKLLVYKNEKEIEEMIKNKSPKVRFNEIKKIAKNVTRCAKPNYGCGAHVPKVKIDMASIKIRIEYNNTDTESDDKDNKFTRELSAEDCQNILAHISDEDCIIMGINPKINRPENLIIKNLIIAPPAIRPVNKSESTSGLSFEDKMSHKYMEIIKNNARLRKYYEKRLEGDMKNREDICLQYHVATFYSNDSTALPKDCRIGDNKKYKSISERIKSKNGIIRMNLMGKRVNYSGRSVITTDPYIGINELGIPIKMVKNLTFPEIVNRANYDRLMMYVKNGRDKYPGANYVIKIDNGVKNYYDLRIAKNDIKLRDGDIVERHLLDGDYVLFNRQPSLHKVSMMAHKVKVLMDDRINTFKMNVNVTEPYNADFDGDEMNVHIPQSLAAMVELEIIANVSKQIISTKNSKPIVQHKQDTIVGSYLLTSSKDKISWKDFANLIMHIDGLEKPSVDKGKMYDPLELFSRILPSKLQYIQGDINNVKFQVINGLITKGKVDKKQLSTFIDIIVDNFGYNRATTFINNSQNLILQWLLLNGLTVGYGDAIISDDVTKAINVELEKKTLEIMTDITQMENNPTIMDVKLFEDVIKNKLSSTKEFVAEIVMNSYDINNGFYSMIKSGSKGNNINLGQIAGSIGQHIVNFNRVKKQVTDRTTSHFYNNDDSPNARGYIYSSYSNGLEPIDAIIDIIAAREGLLDTAVKTADSGYVQRKCVKAMEDLLVCYDFTVRTGNNLIMQFIFGDSGVNLVKQKLVSINLINMDNNEIKAKLSDDNIYYNILKEYRDELRLIQRKASMNVDQYMTIEKEYLLPFNLEQLIKSIIITEKINDNQTETISAEYILKSIEFILDPHNTFLVCMTPLQMNDKNSYIYKDQVSGKFLFKIALLEYLAPKIINSYNINTKILDKITREIINIYNRSLIEPGEYVGIVAAQNCGEFMTQMTLNTFHTAGRGAVGMQGIARFKEIMHVVKNITTPYMFVYFTDEYNKNNTFINKVKMQFKHINIKNILITGEVIYDDISESSQNYNEKDKVANHI